MKENKPELTFDKAWQRSSGSRKRLEQISRHFLSEIHIAPDKSTGPVFLPIYVENVIHQQVARYITEAMASHCDCMLFNMNQPLQKPEDISITEPVNRGLNAPLTRQHDPASVDSMLKQLRTMVSEQTHIPKLGLVALTSQHIALIKQLKRVVIPVTATVDGVRKAYLDIKRLSQHSDPEFSVVILNAKSSADSQRYFEKLAAGVLRFLTLHIFYNGYISARQEYSSHKTMAGFARRMIHNHRLFPED